MGIKIETIEKVIECNCDSCKKDLTGVLDSPNYGKLTPHFGYGSKLDYMTLFKEDQPCCYLCEECWEKVFKLLGLDLDPSTWR